MLRSLFMSLVLVAACSAGAPPTASPAPPTAAPTAAPTVAPTTAPTAAPTASNAPYCNPDYEVCGGPTASPGTETPAPVGDATVALSEDGTYLVGPNGLALYVFDNDSPEQSECGSGCTGTWPPLIVGEGEELVAGDGVTGTLTTFHRDDGDHQVQYDDRPLYYYVGDTAAGHTRGDGIGDVWHLATP